MDRKLDALEKSTKKILQKKAKGGCMSKKSNTTKVNPKKPVEFESTIRRCRDMPTATDAYMTLLLNCYESSIGDFIKTQRDMQKQLVMLSTPLEKFLQSKVNPH